MAEIVNQKIQEMIPEVEQLERFGLLSTAEVKKLIQKRRDFEYRISRPKKNKEDFISYVLFDCKLLELIDLRRQNITRSAKSNRTDVTLCQRVMKRLRYMSRLWPSQKDIWQLRISFSISKKFVDEVSSAYTEQIRYLGNDEDVWIEWAQWEIEGRSNFEKARHILLSKAPLYHPKSILLSKEYFRLELLYIEHLKKKQERNYTLGIQETSEINETKVMNCALPEAIFLNSALKFDNPDLLMQLYLIADRFNFAHRLRDKIFSYTVENYADREVVYKLRAKRSVSGLKEPSSEISVHEGEEQENEKEEKKEEEAIDLRPMEKITTILSIYDEAVEKKGFAFLKAYVEQLCDLLYQCWGYSDYVQIILDKLFTLFERFSSELSSSDFIMWYTLSVYMRKPKSVLKKILFQARATFPSCPYVKLHWLKYRLSINPKIIFNQKRFLEGLSGAPGVELCLTLINNSSAKEPYKQKLFQKAVNHLDTSIAKQMRIRHIEHCKGDSALKTARQLYKKYCFLPPFCPDLHMCMIMKELHSAKVFPKRVRQVFDVAVSQFGKSHVGLWLSYIEFERKYGRKMKISVLNQEAENNLEAKKYQTFIDLKVMLQARQMKNEEISNIFIEEADSKKSKTDEKFWEGATIGPIFQGTWDADTSLSSPEATQKKKEFFLSLAETLNKNEGRVMKKKKEEEKCWEMLLSFLLGEPFHLSVKKVSTDEVSLEQEAREFLEKTNKNFDIDVRNRRAKLSDRLVTNRQTPITVTVDDELEKILRTSETLQPGFLQQKQLIPYYLSKKKKKAINRKEREKTAGEGWFHMKAPELTEEVKRDLEVLKMRSVLHPDRFYKRNDMKVLPKFFQFGKVVDSPVDYYSSRVLKKERKRTLADEIMNEEDVLRYQKRKYSEIVERRETKRRRRNEAQKKENAKSKLKKETKVAKVNLKKTKRVKPKKVFKS